MSAPSGTTEEIKQELATRKQKLKDDLTAAQTTVRSELAHAFAGWAATIDADLAAAHTRQATSMAELPPGFTPHPKIERLLEQRGQMGKGDRPLDWGMAELLAYGSLLHQKINVRMTDDGHVDSADITRHMTAFLDARAGGNERP